MFHVQPHELAVVLDAGHDTGAFFPVTYAHCRHQQPRTETRLPEGNRDERKVIATEPAPTETVTELDSHVKCHGWRRIVT